MAEAETSTTGYMTPEEMAEAEAGFHARTATIYGGCGDDRDLTAESAAALAADAPEALNPAEAFMRLYGGPAGIAKGILVAGMTLYGADFYEKVGGFEAVMDRTIEAAAEPEDGAVLLTFHSAEGNEPGPATFDEDGDKPTGCAYGMSTGAVAELLATNGQIKEVGAENLTTIFGDNKPDAKYALSLSESNRQFAEKVGKGFAVDRPEATKYVRGEGGHPKTPMMILAGSHNPAEKSGVIINLDRHSIGEAGKYYELDVAIAAEIALRAYPELFRGVGEELLLRAFVYDATAVRAVLAKNDTGRLDPRPLRIGVRGNVQQTIKDLRTLSL